jgi:hypothetical protein
MSNENLLLQDISVIGQYEPETIIKKLTELNDQEFVKFVKTNESQDNSNSNFKSVDDILNSLRSTKQSGSQSKGIDNILNFSKKQPWSHTNHQFGYIAPIENSSSESQIIYHPGAIKPDTSLKNSQISIRLDRLHIHKYPGGGTHNVIVTFVARNQVGEAEEPVNFSQVYRVPDGNTAGIVGYPIFIGLNVGSQGLSLKCSTINIKNDEDEAVLQFLESSTFKSGLKLLTTAQPAIAPFSTMGLGLMKYLAEKSKNVAVQNLDLGLDFEKAAMGIRLAEGNYIAVQVPDQNTIDWNKWIYKPKLGAIVHKADDSPLEYNYFVFRVSRYQD